MPIIRNEESLTKTQRQLVDDLANEIRSGAVGRTSPTIIEDVSPYTSNFGVTVVWDRWKGVPQNKRSRIIVDAYTSARRDTETDVPGISLAMGLTSNEATKLAIRF